MNLITPCVPDPHTVPFQTMSLKLELALLSCALLGLRHGFDYDHVAAISDITSVQRSWKQGMGLGMIYALGHACLVAILGVGVIFLHLSLPAGLNGIGERVVGATLIILAMYVAWSLAEQSRLSTPAHTHVPSRIALLISGARLAGWHLKRIRNPDEARPERFSFRYDQGSVFVIGMLHGLGAETPSQLLLFLVAANLGGTSRGLLGLLSFVAGLLMMNSLMTASASGIFAGSADRQVVRALITSASAAYSFIVGAIFLLGSSGKLPLLAH